MKPVKVPLRTDRTALLEKQRQEVTFRRNRLNSNRTAASGQVQKQLVDNISSGSGQETPDEGFGEDLGAAMKLEHSQDDNASVSKNKGSGRSRFAALQDAADQFKEIYNRNSQL